MQKHFGSANNCNIVRSYHAQMDYLYKEWQIMSGSYLVSVGLFIINIEQDK